MPRPIPLRWLPPPQLRAALALLCVAGCARYQFVLVEPVDRVVADGARIVVPIEPMEYRLSSLEDEFLIVRIINPTDEVVEIIGDRTYVVDPTDETHPLGGGIVAPHEIG